MESVASEVCADTIKMNGSFLQLVDYSYEGQSAATSVHLCIVGIQEKKCQRAGERASHNTVIVIAGGLLALKSFNCSTGHAGCDGAFRSPDAPHPLPETRTKLANTMLEFVSCLQDFR
eukprot:1094050-Pelagomonas_calceolata.AAC.4